MLMRTLLLVCAFALAAAPLRAQRRSNLITPEEIERSGPTVGTAYEAVVKLRPRWLQRVREGPQPPGSSSDPARFAQIRVYQDDHDMGGVDYLKTIPAEYVAWIRWLSTSEAGSRFGTVQGPVIAVTMKPAGPP